MAVHVLMNQKGGVGKSTLAINLAAVKADVLTAPPAGLSPVLAVSIDPQGSAVWWADRVDSVGELPFRIAQAHEDVETLRHLRDLPGVEHVVVDTPGWIGDTPGSNDNGTSGNALEAVLASADLVIVPIVPEALAFDPTARTITKVLEPRGIPFKVVINNWDPRDGRVDLEQTQDFVCSQGWPLANTVVRHYKVHARAAAEGRVVTEYAPNRVALQAREDFQRLCLELEVGGGRR